MKAKIQFVKRFFYKVLSFFPTLLPQGMNDFNIWADSIIFAYDLPDNASVRFALAVAVLHADNEPKQLLDFLLGAPARRSKRYFALKMLKGAANQVAGGVMEDLKTKQQELARKEQEAANKPTMSIVPDNSSGAV